MLTIIYITPGRRLHIHPEGGMHEEVHVQGIGWVVGDEQPSVDYDRILLDTVMHNSRHISVSSLPCV